MKKQYTKKQITEAIAYWQKQLKLGNYKKVNESQTNDDGTVKPYNVGDILWDTYEDEELEPVKVKRVIKTPHTSKYGTIYYYSYECFTLGRGTVTLDHFQLKPLKLKQ